MSERLPEVDPSRFPDLDADPTWVRSLPAGTAFARISKTAGPHPVRWHDFRSYGPLDARFDPHPGPVGDHPGEGVLYAVLERPAITAFDACVLEVFQSRRIIRRSEDAPEVTIFAVTRELRLLDVSDSDWISVAGGNAAISSGERAQSRRWARAIRQAYPQLDGVISASSVIPSERVVAMWAPAQSALPRHPLARMRLDRDELSGVVDRAADRYGYLIL